MLLTMFSISCSKKCCGIYSWKDAEPFRPKACCSTGYIGIPGNGSCNEHFGPNVKNCIEARSTVLIYEINRFALTLTAIILTQVLI